jgi:N-ethylmaleimide reductase
MQDCDEPHALTTAEVGDVIAEYRQATANALKAGCEGVELHAASGYLPMQFLSPGSNQRTDRYGGSVENRVRFVVETLRAMIDVAGADRVGVRICPGNPFNDIDDPNPVETYATLMRAVKPLKLAYLHLIHLNLPTVDGLALAREIQPAPLMINESLTFESAQQYVADGTAVAASFARFFVSNPDLVQRWRTGAALAPFDRRTLYTPGPKGYTDYPALS